MPINYLNKSGLICYLKSIAFLVVVFSSCTIPKKFQKDKPFLFSNNIEVIGQNLSKDEKSIIKTRLEAQLDDSARIVKTDKFLILHYINQPPVFDTSYAGVSARNMAASMVHIGYYSSIATYKVDTTIKKDQKRVSVSYQVKTGPPTLIDTIGYQLKKEDLQALALKTLSKSFLQKGRIVTKADINAERARLVDLYRNNGYFKFSSDDLQVLGDTTIASLTTISDDPFESLRLLAEAQQKRNKPTIKLAMVLNPLTDTNKLKQYYINNIHIYPDFYTTTTTREIKFTADTVKGYTIFHRRKLFKNSFILSNMVFAKGDLYRQDDYTRTINNFSKAGLWQSINIQAVETKDSTGKLDMNIQLLPVKKYGFEANLETSYSTNNNYSLGNLLGFSVNTSLQNRNIGKVGVKMTHALHAGVELNVSKNKSTDGLINSNEVGYTNTISIPKLGWPFRPEKGETSDFWDTRNKTAQQTFINTSVSYTNRINLFNLQSLGLAVGYSWNNKKNGNWVFKLLNVEFSRLYNESQSFADTLAKYPYLKYSFKTALVIGTSVSYTYNYGTAKNVNTLKINIEESGHPLFFPLAQTGLFEKYLRQFAKGDFEFTKTIYKNKTANVFRFFLGVGWPYGKQDSSLPFFKQYFAGGSNSMRGWPIRGIGQGARPLAPYGSGNNFNDRTGDVRIEGNYENRHNLWQIIPGSISLKGAFFIDAGNIWNFKNTRPGGGPDSLQFNIANLYKQLGVSAGYGFRVDFNYFLIRFDLGFRFKKPDITEHAGWQLPNIFSFNNLFKRGVNLPDPMNPGKTYNDERYKKWRYENFNFTIGISYPF